LLTVPILGGYGIVLFIRGLVDLTVRRPVEAIGAYTVKLQANAGRTWPGVGGCSIALDLSPAATLASSHNWKHATKLVLAHGDATITEELGDERHTLQPLVSVVLVHEYIV
jgi:hypothetical protein